VGKSKNTNASTAIGSTQIQLASQAAARPAGSDPGSATRACSPYCAKKPPSPSARLPTSNSQPTRLLGRREARTKPTTGTARFATPPKTLEKSHPVSPAGTRCRSTYASASAPAPSKTDPTAAQPAAHRTVRILIPSPTIESAPSAPCPQGPRTDHAPPQDRAW